jgi:hypothetical protein
MELCCCYVNNKKKIISINDSKNIIQVGTCSFNKQQKWLAEVAAIYFVAGRQYNK